MTFGSEHFEILLAALLVAVAGLNALATRTGIPYPIVLVVGGVVIGIAPGMARVELAPELVLLVFCRPCCMRPSSSLTSVPFVRTAAPCP